jgi:hypothetical protein
MKVLLIPAVLILSLHVNAQTSINLKMGSYLSVIRNFRDTAGKALQIASFILSTQEFKDSLLKYRFKCSNLNCNSSITGQRVYDSLTRFSDTTLALNINKLNWLKKLSIRMTISGILIKTNIRSIRGVGICCRLRGLGTLP